MKRFICILLTLTLAAVFITASASAQSAGTHEHGLWLDKGCTSDYNQPGFHVYQCGYYGCLYAMKLYCPGDYHVYPGL